MGRQVSATKKESYNRTPSFEFPVAQLFMKLCWSGCISIIPSSASWLLWIPFERSAGMLTDAKQCLAQIPKPTETELSAGQKSHITTPFCKGT